MPRLLVLQHVAYEILGTLDPLLRRAGFRIRYVNFGRDPHAQPTIDGYDGLIVLGGPMNVGQDDAHPHLPTEMRLIERAIEVGVPTLGICLGAQLIAATLGARVHPAARTEIGWYEVEPTSEGRADPVLAHFRPREHIFQWHGDTFDLPAGAERLVTADPVENQAFRYGEDVYGLQFHLEVDEPMIARWLKVPGHVEQITRLNGEIDPDGILRDTPTKIGRLTEISDRTFSSFIDLLGRPRRHQILPSR